MSRREQPAGIHEPRRPTREPAGRRSPAPAQVGRCFGAAAQLAAVHHVLRGRPVAQLRAARPAPVRRLPHECGHVVQQAQGRVRPTQAKRARGAGPAPSAGDGVVQRAIGYEAEVGALDVAGVPGQPAPNLRKGMVLWRGNGWDVSVDDLGQRFDLEFRTDPINDLVSGGRGTAQSRLATIVALWTRIASVRGLQPANTLNSSAPANVGIERIGYQSAQLQASAGLSLDALRAIRTGAARGEFATHQGQAAVNALGQFGGAADAAIADTIAGHQGQIRAALGLGPVENIGNLSAVIGMIVNIPFTARHGGITYAKQAAGPLLARTDFATILAQLPPNQVQAIRSHPNQWRDLLIGIADRAINIDLAVGEQPAVINANTPAFEPDSFEGANTLANLRLGGWFEGLAQGEDRMTASDHAARHGDQAAADRLESLGSYGTRMDAGSYSLNQGALAEMAGGLAVTVAGIAAGVTTGVGAAEAVGGGALMVHGASNIGTANLNRPIFEFRALALANEQELVQAGLALWDYVDVAHGRGPGGGNQLSAYARLWNWFAS